MAGYAGTGKTTILAHWIRNEGLDPVICAPTAKAALVLRKKLSMPLLRVGTIHSYLYTPKSASRHNLDLMEAKLAAMTVGSEASFALQEQILKERRSQIKGRMSFALKEGSEDEPQTDLIIVDEASMVTRQMHKDLFERSRKVLYVGDEAQLPPVGCGGFFHKSEADIRLEHIHRQALDNPIIALAQMIREGCEPSSYRHPGCEIRIKSQMAPEEFLEADQVLIGSNRGRHKLNRFFRERLWGPGYARAALMMPGERLVCKQNATKSDPALVNGALFTVEADEPLAAWNFDTSKRPYKPVKHPVESTLLKYGDQDYTFAEIFLGLMIGNYHEDIEHVDQSIMLDANVRYGLGCLDFDYSYGITVHSSQGSEWDKVVLCDDWAGNDRKRWLYTAVTRAKESLIWVKG